ncbi:hypothetical protein [Streptomyces buecherae]|uniref:Uncharacterized protein n=1 Tax=Streptomyces buecherae TaxID=2763006 RepID=A0A7H8N3G6_9ACTN|nr:hypothetical protein [Streptomyces buecherae]QKW48891.1 hypothetical protein HUT08_04295 [Streptomyces buecherae]
MNHEELMNQIEDAATEVKWELRFEGEGPEADAIDLVVSLLHARLTDPRAGMADVAARQGTNIDEMRTWWHWGW